MGDESVGTIGHIDRTNMSCKRKYTENDDDTGKYARFTRLRVAVLLLEYILF